MENLVESLINLFNGLGKEVVSRTDMLNNQVYLFSLLLEAITRLVKFICYVAIFIFTSIGLTILVNEQLRNLVFQGFFLK